MSIFGNKPGSLIEQKKQQWAKEREELARLAVPWGKTYSKFDNNSRKSRIFSKFSNSEHSLARDEHYSPRNLPPIQRNKSYERYDIEGETSGYASDSAKESTPEYYINQNQDGGAPPGWNNRSSESEVSTSREDRPKWGDRGLGVGHLWEPHEINEHFNKSTVDLPGWMQRGLSNDKEVLEVSGQSPTDSADRPNTGESINTMMNLHKTHLRGQNIPLDTIEAAERERKRQKAVELQDAIKQQLAEREIKRKQDRERRLREEVEEETRIRREQEIERRRVEEEHKMIMEKKERERKRNQVMHEAIENAERQAKLEKSKLKNRRTSVLPVEEEIKKEVIPSSLSPIAPSPSPISPNLISNNNPPDEESPVPVPVQDSDHFEQEMNELRIQTDNHLNLNDSYIPNDNLTLVIPNNTYDNLQGMQLALLVPTMPNNLPNTLPLAVPIAVGDTPERVAITENRVLTPTVYRMKKNCRETSTQTENSHFKYYKNQEVETDTSYRKEDRYGSLDRRRMGHGDRKDRRLRSEERNNTRPKWGANCPPTRYLKQSEKDPTYQKRKMRQKKLYEDKNNNYSQSSDESVPPTPDHRLYRKQSYNRNLWHKNERLFSQNISVYQTEIVPLEMDQQGRLYVKDIAEYRELQSQRGRKYRESTPDSSRTERFTPRIDLRKEKLNERNQRRKDDTEILDKLNNLRQGLLLKQQQQWDDNDLIRLKSTLEFPDVHDNP